MLAHLYKERIMADMKEKIMLPKTQLLPLMLPWSEFFSDRRLGGTVSGELMLKMKVLEDGLWDYWILAIDSRGSAEFLEEEAWVLAEDLEWEYSFENLCRFFSVDAGDLRRALVKWKQFHDQLRLSAR